MKQTHNSKVVRHMFKIDCPFGLFKSESMQVDNLCPLFHTQTQWFLERVVQKIDPKFLHSLNGHCIACHWWNFNFPSGTWFGGGDVVTRIIQNFKWTKGRNRMKTVDDRTTLTMQFQTSQSLICSCNNKSSWPIAKLRKRHPPKHRAMFVVFSSCCQSSFKAEFVYLFFQAVAYSEG